MRVTRATDDDLAEIAESSRHWTDPMPSGAWWVLDGEAEHGYAGAEVRDGVLHLTRCYVAVSHRGMGGQRALIRARLAWGRRCGATSATTYTHIGNVASARSLQRCGFLLASTSSTPDAVWLTWGRAL